MSSVQAVTSDLVLNVRIASFYPLNDGDQKEIVMRFSKLIEDIGKEKNFIVWRTALSVKE